MPNFQDIKISAFVEKGNVFKIEWFYYEDESRPRQDDFSPMYFRVTCADLNYNSGWVYKNKAIDGTNNDIYLYVKNELDK